MSEVVIKVDDVRKINQSEYHCPQCGNTQIMQYPDCASYKMHCHRCNSDFVVTWQEPEKPRFGYIVDVRCMLSQPLAEWWTGYSKKESEELAISIIEVKLDICDKWMLLNVAYNKPRQENHALADTLIGKPARISHSSFPPFIHLLRDDDRDWYTYEAFVTGFNPFGFTREDFPSEEKLNCGDWSR